MAELMTELMAFKRIQVMHFGTKSWNTISSHLRTTLYFNSIFLFSLAEVTAAMSVDKNKSVSFRWEKNSFFMQILQKRNLCKVNQGRLVT